MRLIPSFISSEHFQSIFAAGIIAILILATGFFGHELKYNVNEPFHSSAQDQEDFQLFQDHLPQNFLFEK